MNTALFCIELRARGLIEDIKTALDGDSNGDNGAAQIKEAERYLTTCAFALDRFIQYLEECEWGAI